MTAIVFMGTPDFAVPTLQKLVEHFDVIGVVTQPDRPAGRNRQLQQSPVKQLALAHKIPVFQPDKLRRPDALAALKQWTADVYVVAAYGQILPQEVLDIPPYGSLNVHASLLPRWRGAAPIQAAIRAGDTETGITIMKMDAGLDTGPILTQRSVAITSDETGQSLHDKLALVGGQLMVETLPAYIHGDIQPQSQDDQAYTYAPMIKKEEGHIDWQQSALMIERLVRAFYPWPGTYALWNDQPVKILAGRADSGHAKPGTVVEKNSEIAIGTGDGLFYPTQLQLSGRNALPVEAFVRGRPDFVTAFLV